MERELSNEQKLRIIWRDEGVDAAMRCARHLGFTKRQAWDMITKWMFK